MLYIKRLEVEGFKTFSKKTVLDLQPGYLTITGLNGSGKSNIFDAILFALGESSLKTLRATNMKGLIFDGAVSGQRSSKALVSVQFNNSGREIPFDSDTVTFTRELRGDGESIFKINGKHVSKQTVLNLTQLCLISPEAFNVILQGMINRVAELRPDERRRLLESLVGVSQFDEKKAESMKNLEDATHKLEIAFARIGEIRSVLRKNEEGRNNLLRYRHLEEEIRRLNAMKTSRSIFTLLQASNSLNGNLEEERSLLKKKQHDREAIYSDIESIQNDRDNFLSSVSDPSRTFVNYEMELASFQSRISSMNSVTKALEQRNIEIEQDLPTLNGMLTKLDIDVNFVKESLNKIKTDKELREGEKAQVSEKIKVLTLQISDANKSISDIKMRKIKADQKIKKIDSILEKISMHRNKFTSIQTKLSYRLNVLDSKQKSFSVILNELRLTLTNLDNLLQSESSQILSVSNSYDGIESRRRIMFEAIRVSLTTLEKVQVTVAKTEIARKIAEEVFDSEGLERLITLAKTGVVEGCVGFVKDLIDYDEHYSKAISSACGFWMNAIVVKDIESANKLIELAGRVSAKQFNMIILSEVKPIKLTKLSDDKNVLGYLYDLVKISDEYAALKDFLFQNTVLVEDDGIASEVSKNGFRCVTVNGAIYEPYYSAYLSSFPSIFGEAVLPYGEKRYYSELESAISNLKKVVDKRRQDIENLELKGKDMLEKKATISKNLGQVHGEIDTLIKFVKKYSETYDENTKKLNSLRARVNKVEEYLKRFQERSDTLNRKRGIFAKIVQSDEDNAAAQKLISFNGEMANLNGNYQSIISQLNEINLQLAQTQNRLENDLLVSYNNTKRSIEKLASEFESNKKKIEENKNLLSEFNTKYNSLKAREEEFRQASANMQKTISEYDLKVNEKRVQLSSLNDLINKSTVRINQISSKIDNLKEKMQTEYNTLRMFGYESPIEYVDGCETVLSFMEQESSEVKLVLNYLAEKDYENVFESYKNLSLRSNQLEEEKSSIIDLIEQIEEKKKTVFMEAFEKIDRNLRSLFKELTDGDAWLEIEKPDDIFSGGVYLMVRFPNKRYKESLMISGGEKTIATVAFILAMQVAFKSPFYLLDEIDAHLDPFNLERLIKILHERAAESQIILITLKDVTLSKADKIFGVYQRSGHANVVEYSPEMMVKEARS
ncbi:MAG: chromosome segregation SMC family protein [Nitrososphaeria archaeon]|jgi:chromosome segregation protein